MNTFKDVLLRLACLAVIALPNTSFSQSLTLAQLQTDLISTWLVTVEGEERSRLFRVSAAAPSSESKLLLDATYGWIDGNLTPVVASAMQSGQVTMLHLTTQANSQISAALVASTVFEGTFTDNKGRVKAVRLQKASPNEIAEKAILKPSADVPAQCSAFSGKWVGNWPGYGQTWLWVTKVDTNCKIRVGHSSDSNFPTRFYSNEIKEGVLSWRNSDGSRNSFKFDDDSLWGNYFGPTGQSNSAHFKREL